MNVYTCAGGSQRGSESARLILETELRREKASCGSITKAHSISKPLSSTGRREPQADASDAGVARMSSRSVVYSRRVVPVGFVLSEEINDCSLDLYADKLLGVVGFVGGDGEEITSADSEGSDEYDGVCENVNCEKRDLDAERGMAKTWTRREGSLNYLKDRP